MHTYKRPGCLVAWPVALPHQTDGFQDFLNPLAVPRSTEAFQDRIHMPAINLMPFSLFPSLI